MRQSKNTKPKKSPTDVKSAVFANIDKLSEKTAKSILKHIVSKVHAEEFTSGNTTHWNADTVMDVHSWFVSAGILDPILFNDKL